ncbi:MAG TPA: hypothetical protein DCE55_13165, partial [Planctomycetaceae bacterium]|nr:hypothetical protein [Planctomycetaceae bacterium]
LSQERPEAVLSAARALGRFGAAAKDAIPALIATLTTLDPPADDTTLPRTFRRIGPESIAPLAKLLQSDSPRLLKMAATCLERFGPGAAVALPALETHREHADPAVSTAVQTAIAKIAPSP